MTKTKIIPNTKTAFDKYTTYTPSEIAKICLECPLPTCTKTECKRFKTERKKIQQN